MAKRGGCDADLVIRQGYLGKRSQNFKRFSPIANNLRWFCLTKHFLIYYDSESEKQREKGRIPLNSVKWIEKEKTETPPNERLGPLSCLSFSQGNTQSNTGIQVGYSFQNKTRILNIQALDEGDRDIWINSLLSCCLNVNGNTTNAASNGTTIKNSDQQTHQNQDNHNHRGIWSPSSLKWTCCDSGDRDGILCVEPPILPLLLHQQQHQQIELSQQQSMTIAPSTPPPVNAINLNSNSVIPTTAEIPSITCSRSSSNSSNLSSNNQNHQQQQHQQQQHHKLPLPPAIVQKIHAVLAANHHNNTEIITSNQIAVPEINSAISSSLLNSNNKINSTTTTTDQQIQHTLTSLNNLTTTTITSPPATPYRNGINTSTASNFSPLETSSINNHSSASFSTINSAFMSSPEMAGGNSTTPTSKPRDKTTTAASSSSASAGSRRTVVALYPFKAIENGDLTLQKGEEYEVVDDSQEHWWQVRDKNGSVGYIPSNYVKEKEFLGLQKYDWYVGDMSRQRAETLLRFDDKEGCFLVRNSSSKGLYTLSLYTKVPHSQIKHYHIKQNGRTEFYLSEKHCCPSIPDLITYHRHNSGGLASRLKHPPSAERCAPTTAGLSHDKWEIDPSELMLHEELGSGQFGVVRRGKWRGCIDVAVKMMKEGTMSEDDFIEEAKVMTKLQHPNLVQLYGVCSKHRPIYIVTEYMKHGALLHYLRRHETAFHVNIGLLLDMVIQGMTYLERHNYIHRDLASRNCLVGNENIVKVADFGLARLAHRHRKKYTSSGGTKFPIKWAPPEVLNYTRFSSKSDVWAYGVLIWEIFTCGKMPYGRMKNTEVVERVQRGLILEKPKNCPKELYDLMRNCWALHPDERPSFRSLKEQLVVVAQILLVD